MGYRKKYEIYLLKFHRILKYVDCHRIEPRYQAATGAEYAVIVGSG